MSKGADAFSRLTDEAQKLNNEYWVETGNNTPQLNSMFAALLLRIEELERLVKNNSSVPDSYENWQAKAQFGRKSEPTKGTT